MAHSTSLSPDAKLCATATWHEFKVHQFCKHGLLVGKTSAESPEKHWQPGENY